MQETWVWSLGWEDPLEKGKATQSSILAWSIHGLYSPWGRKELHTTEQLSFLSANKHNINISKWFKRLPLKTQICALGIHTIMVQFSSVTQSCSTLCNLMDCSTARFPCPSPTARAFSNSRLSSRWCHPTISSSVVPLSFTFNLSQHQVFSNESGLCIKWPKYAVSASASVLPKNIQDWFPLGLTGLISLQSKGLSRGFSNTSVQKHQIFGAQLSLWSNSHIHTWLPEKPLLWLDGPLLAK